MAEIITRKETKPPVIKGTTLGEQLELLALGYEPVPILASAKKPLIKGWTTGLTTAERLTAWRTHTSTSALPPTTDVNECTSLSPGLVE